MPCKAQSPLQGWPLSSAAVEEARSKESMLAHHKASRQTEAGAHQHEVSVLRHVPPDAEAHVPAVRARHCAILEHVLRMRVRVLSHGSKSLSAPSHPGVFTWQIVASAVGMCSVPEGAARSATSA